MATINPLQFIMMLETTLETIDDNDFAPEYLNYIVFAIDIIEKNNSDENSLEIINNLVTKYTVNEKPVDLTIVKDKCKTIIPILEKLCNTENMMEFFTYSMYTPKK